MDLGGTNLRVASVGAGGDVGELYRVPTLAREGPEPVIARIVAAIGHVCDGVSASGGNIRGVVLGAPGIISSRNGTVVASPNLPGWRDVPLRDRIATAVGLPVFLENDANAAAYGEYWRGAGEGCASLVLLTLGTGVGGGLVLGGELWRGLTGWPAKWATSPSNPAGAPVAAAMPDA